METIAHRRVLKTMLNQADQTLNLGSEAPGELEILSMERVTF